jgi:hypothetical protein
MTQITIDASIRDKLLAAREPVRLVDVEGHVLGTFNPVALPPYDPELIPPPTSPEEVERRFSQPGRPLVEILLDLRQSS